MAPGGPATCVSGDRGCWRGSPGTSSVARGRIAQVLALADRGADRGGRRRASRDVVHAELAAFEPGSCATRSAGAWLELICRCDSAYPARLRDARRPAGGIARCRWARAVSPFGRRGAGRDRRRAACDAIWAGGRAVAGARPRLRRRDRAQRDGAGGRLGRSRGCAGSRGARRWPCCLAAPTAHTQRPSAALHARIRAAGAAVSELPPGSDVRRWTFRRAQPDHRGTERDYDRGRGGGALRRAADRRIRAESRPAGRRRARPGQLAAVGGTERPAGGGRTDRARAPGRARRAVRRGRRAQPPRARRPRSRPSCGRCLAAIGEGYDTASALARAGFAIADGSRRWRRSSSRATCGASPGGSSRSCSDASTRRRLALAIRAGSDLAQ